MDCVSYFILGVVFGALIMLASNVFLRLKAERYRKITNALLMEIDPRRAMAILTAEQYLMAIDGSPGILPEDV